MSLILCPTRGGQSSIPNQQWAISLAKERNADLAFLYISNIRFLEHVSSPVLVDISHELDEMGEFLLAMAQDRAAAADIVAQTIVRQGDFQEAMTAVILELSADTVVIGQAASGTGVTTESYMNGLADSVNETGAELFVVDDGQVVHHYKPAATAQIAEPDEIDHEQ